MNSHSLGTRLGMFEIVGDVPVDPVRIDGDEAILGRDPGSDIVLEDPRVSRRHARVWLDEHRMMIQDLGSRSGTVVNGTPIAGETELRTGDHLRLGLTELAVVWNPGLANTLDMPTIGGESDATSERPTVVVEVVGEGAIDVTEGYRTVGGVPMRHPASGKRNGVDHLWEGRPDDSAVIPAPARTTAARRSEHVRDELPEEVGNDATNMTDNRPPWLRSLMRGVRGRRAR